jgi:hypothetical protein
MAWIRRPLRYLQGVLGLSRRDVMLSSFPRSGSTWVRFFLCNLISLREWGGREIDFDLLDRTMVAFGANDLTEPWPHRTIPRVVKTHRRYLPLFARASGAIGVVRDPRDVMVSYYHFRKDYQGRDSGAFPGFIRDRRFGLASWFRHYQTWRDHWTLMVKYEDLKRDAFSEFTSILDVLGVGYPEDVVSEAIRRSDIRNVRKVEEPSTASGKPAWHARDGRTEQWTAYFTDADLSYYRELVERFDVRVYEAED